MKIDTTVYTCDGCGAISDWGKGAEKWLSIVSEGLCYGSHFRDIRLLACSPTCRKLIFKREAGEPATLEELQTEAKRLRPDLDERVRKLEAELSKSVQENVGLRAQLAEKPVPLPSPPVTHEELRKLLTALQADQFRPART